MSDKLLIIYISIGDEDGPSLSFYIANYNDYNIMKYKNNTVVVNLDDFMFDLSKSKYLNCDYNDIFNKYRIIDILEIHDWYDYLNKKEVIEKQKFINDYLVLSYYKQPLTFIIVVSYNQDPIKYLIPYNSPSYKYIKSKLNIFSEDNNHEAKQDLANMMKQYIVFGSYSSIVKNGGNFIEHIVVISDEIDEKDHINFE